MKKFSKIIIILVASIMLLTIGAMANAGFHISKHSTEYGLNTYTLVDRETNREYIIVESPQGIVITPRLSK